MVWDGILTKAKTSEGVVRPLMRSISCYQFENIERPPFVLRGTMQGKNVSNF